MIVLDTNVLVYAVGRDHPLREACRRLIDALGDGGIDATTTVEVIQEYVHVRARRVARSTAVAEAEHLQLLLRPLHSTEEADLVAGFPLFDGHALGCFDAVLAATARRLGATLVSADRAFGSVEGLHHLDPGSPTFLGELGIGFGGEDPGR